MYIALLCAVVSKGPWARCCKHHDKLHNPDVAFGQKSLHAPHIRCCTRGLLNQQAQYTPMLSTPWTTFQAFDTCDLTYLQRQGTHAQMHSHITTS